MTEGEKVHIHAASGAWGSQRSSRATPALVFATAGSTDKREFIASLGVEHVLNSRTLAFADEVMAGPMARASIWC
jgi:NADPH-dependent curcumin reductase CurA